MSYETPRPTWRECAQVVQAVLNGDKFEDQPKDIAYTVISANLITREEQKKPCKTCGTPQHDFSYWRVSTAGRLLAAALADQP